MGTSYGEFLTPAKAKIAAGAPRHAMTDPELVSVYAYTTSDTRWGYSPLNEALRSGDEARIANVENYRDTLNAALARLPDQPGTVKRGAMLPESVLERYSVGAVVTEDAFTSTSTGPGFSGPHRFLIYSRHGKRIEPYSAHPSEHEVLFAAGTRFEVYEIKPGDGGQVTIYMEEIE